MATINYGQPYFQGGGVSLYAVPPLAGGQSFSLPGATLYGIPIAGGAAPAAVPATTYPVTTSPATAGNLTGARTGRGSERAGYVPEVPDPAESMRRAIEGSQANLGGLYQLGGSLNRWMGEQAKAARELALPGSTDALSKALANVGYELAGQVSPETIANLTTLAAERGISVGAGSPNANAALMRSLGLTTEGLKRLGLQDLAQTIGLAPVGKQFDPTSMLLTPADQQQWAYLANVLAASPNPEDQLAYNEMMAKMGLEGGALSAMPRGSQSYYPRGAQGYYPGTAGVTTRAPAYTPTVRAPAQTTTTPADYLMAGPEGGAIPGLQYYNVPGMSDLFGDAFAQQPTTFQDLTPDEQWFMDQYYNQTVPIELSPAYDELTPDEQYFMGSSYGYQPDTWDQYFDEYGY